MQEGKWQTLNESKMCEDSTLKILYASIRMWISHTHAYELFRMHLYIYIDIVSFQV